VQLELLALLRLVGYDDAMVEVGGQYDVLRHPIHTRARVTEDELFAKVKLHVRQTVALLLIINGGRRGVQRFVEQQAAFEGLVASCEVSYQPLVRDCAGCVRRSVKGAPAHAQKIRSVHRPLANKVQKLLLF
jgi:hypothetical protein